MTEKSFTRNSKKKIQHTQCTWIISCRDLHPRNS